MYNADVNTHPLMYQYSCVVSYRQGCNGGIPLNNQRTFHSHQNLLYHRRMSSPKNYIRSRNNSSSSTRSMCNHHFHLSRQNTFPTRRRKLHSQSSVGSGFFPDDFKNNDLSDYGQKQDSSSGSNEDDEDPDAMDEAVSYSITQTRLCNKRQFFHGCKNDIFR